MNQHIHYTVGNEKRVTSLRKMALELESLKIGADSELHQNWYAHTEAGRTEFANIKNAIVKEQVEIDASQRPPSKLKRNK